MRDLSAGEVVIRPERMAKPTRRCLDVGDSDTETADDSRLQVA
jgi:hypothetical protein